MSTPENTPETIDQSVAQTPVEETIGAVIKRLGPAAWLPIAWAVLPGIAGITLLANMDFAQRMLIGTEENPGLSFGAGIAVFIGIFIVSAGLGVLPTVSQAILAGFAFGITWGFPAALVGFAGASVIGYFIAGFVARDRIEKEIHNHPKASIIRDAFIHHGKMRAMLILTLLRVPPNSPFALTNYAMSVAGVKLLPFMVATVVGMAPRTFAAVWIGSQVSSWDEVHTPKWLVVGGIVFTVVLLVGLGKLANKALESALKITEEA